ncbi:MAG: proteasome subunit alpha [Acidimicrobiia bacterium]
MSVPFYVSPEQLVKDRAEFARKGIARGRAIVAMQYADGILLLAENTSSTLHKIGEVYDRVAFAGVGRYNEFESLRVAGIRHADLKGYMYGRRDVTAKGLANAFAQTLGNIFTHEVKPYEVELLVAELGDEPTGDRLFRVLYDGTLGDEQGVAAIGGPADELLEALRSDFDPTRDLATARRVAEAAFVQVIERSVDGWEPAVLERSDRRRAFRRLD